MSKDLFWEDKNFDLVNYLKDSIDVMDEEQKIKIGEILKRIEDGEKKGFSLQCERKLMGYKPSFSGEIYSFQSFAYSTNRNGDAYNVAVYFLARNTGKKDKEDWDVLESDDGTFFVVEKWAGSPSHFGGMTFRKPKF